MKWKRLGVVIEGPIALSPKNCMNNSMKLNQKNTLVLTPVVLGYVVLYLILVEQLQIDLAKLFGSFAEKGPIIVIYFLAGLLLPVISGAVPRPFKEAIIFWRIKDRLPGYRAFSKYAHSDYRIDGAKLIDSINGIPESPREENALWYQMYNRFETDDRVRASNKLYLLYRDLGALSVLTLVLSSMVFLFRAGEIPGFVIFSATLGFMYFVSVIGAIMYSRSLVKQVLAIHYSGVI